MPVAALLLTVLAQYDGTGSDCEAPCCAKSQPPGKPLVFAAPGRLLEVLCVIPEDYGHFTYFISKLCIYTFLHVLLLPEHAKLQHCILGSLELI